jgi:putative nucleotidyltransferase with HDIG domain
MNDNWKTKEQLVQELEDLRRKTSELEKSESALKKKEEELNQSLEKLHKALGGIIQAITMAVETHDPYTAGHQHRVANLARSIGQEMGLTKDQIEAIRVAGIVHDLGKISIPAEILSKLTQLSSLEFNLIRVHSQISYNILKDIDFPWPIAEIVYQHHERINGSGYPLVTNELKSSQNGQKFLLTMD